jgi:hypothetical protein
MNYLELLSVGWTAWQFTRKRFGTVGGLLAAVVVVAGYAVLMGRLRDDYPGLAERLE